jgi:hypothetical protein
MKYFLYHEVNDKYVLQSEVTLSGHQATHMSTAGFGFAMDIFKCVPQWMVHPTIVIGDDSNWFAQILPDSKSLEECLTIGTRFDYAHDTDQQLRCLGLMDPLEP